MKQQLRQRCCCKKKIVVIFAFGGYRHVYFFKKAGILSEYACLFYILFEMSLKNPVQLTASSLQLMNPPLTPPPAMPIRRTPEKEPGVFSVKT